MRACTSSRVTGPTVGRAAQVDRLRCRLRGARAASSGDRRDGHDFVGSVDGRLVAVIHHRPPPQCAAEASAVACDRAAGALKVLLELLSGRRRAGVRACQQSGRPETAAARTGRAATQGWVQPAHRGRHPAQRWGTQRGRQRQGPARVRAPPPAPTVARRRGRATAVEDRCRRAGGECGAAAAQPREPARRVARRTCAAQVPERHVAPSPPAQSGHRRSGRRGASPRPPGPEGRQPTPPGRPSPPKPQLGRAVSTPCGRSCHPWRQRRRVARVATRTLSWLPSALAGSRSCPAGGAWRAPAARSGGPAPRSGRGPCRCR